MWVIVLPYAIFIPQMILFIKENSWKWNIDLTFSRDIDRQSFRCPLVSQEAGRRSFQFGGKFSGLLFHVPTLQQMKLCFTRAVDPVKQKAITRLSHRSVLQWDYLVGGKDYVPEDAIPERLRAWLAVQRALCVIWILWYAGLMRELRNMRSVLTLFCEKEQGME